MLDSPDTQPTVSTLGTAKSSPESALVPELYLWLYLAEKAVEFPAPTGPASSRARRLVQR